MEFKDKVRRAEEFLFFRPYETIGYVVEKTHPKRIGMPVPSARLKDWPIYVAEYDPFNWDEKHVLSDRDKKRRKSYAK